MLDPTIGNQIEWPCDLPQELIDSLLDIAVFKAGIHHLEITKKFQNLPGVFYILSGSAGICFSAENMKSISGGVIGRGDWIGALSIHADYNLFAVAEEIEPITMVLFPAEKVLELAEEQYAVFKWLLHSGTKAQSIWMQAYLSSIHEKEQKTIYVLLELAARQNNIAGATVSINISQTQLSSITGISRSRLNEVLKGIEQQGLVEIQRGKVFITDVEGLYERISPMNLMMRDPVAEISNNMI
ncbi:Crp/Fnr family transcriptional regulator [Vibrio sp. 10N.261.46.E12]|uniref:Crp/Fnr family transcriptional regulator n=1 Tax=unclassified Vibrio TaxID=2614977 RepID=UPI0009774BF9|nr:MULTISPECIES: Crp/Fnr family transcriptional regulator [unclassified Vibrio]OMO37641.1 protein kinase [Vibrio sp. 10N.261.45.E1]PMJ19634.1 protein kinase [Vibrio sp. 10N.286.45.B6]PML93121.1 protein kinase [Vibrio sp. 10N.261.49.E11]PMM66614.1 protein kinase [Vibrio sp. 10N.261.46.F12]PMM86348.1 protein kinase [Vibrio sp. 10N.261.46.E8]